MTLSTESVDAILATNDWNGFVLDGFPRNLAQAEALDEMLRAHEMPLDAVIEFVINDSVLKQRILGRFIHPPSGRTYHTLFHPPKHPMMDDITHDKLIRRHDDNEETLGMRLMTYKRETKPLIEYYDQRGIVCNIDAGKRMKRCGEIWEGSLKEPSVAGKVTDKSPYMFASDWAISHTATIKSIKLCARPCLISIKICHCPRLHPSAINSLQNTHPPLTPTFPWLT